MYLLRIYYYRCIGAGNVFFHVKTAGNPESYVGTEKQNNAFKSGVYGEKILYIR